jgi:hypothetical protein
VDQEPEEVGELASDERELVSRILGMEIPAIGLDSEASFERLMRAVGARHDRRRRRRRLFVRFLGAATVIIALVAMLRLLLR